MQLVPVLVLVAVLVGCATEVEDWPEDAREDFLEVCVEASGGQTAYCTCVLEELEEAYTYDEFSAIEREIDETGAMPDELDAMIDACAREHIG